MQLSWETVYNRLRPSIRQALYHPNLVQINGVIGRGKSTMLDRFSTDHWRKVEEPVKINPYLEQFYAELQENKPGMWCTPYMEVFLYGYREFALGGNTDVPTVTDFGSVKVFAKMLQGKMGEREYDTFLLASALSTMPRLIIYLEGVEVAYKQMLSRDRDCEKGLPKDYLYSLDKTYREYMRWLETKGVAVEYVKPGKFEQQQVDAVLLKYGFPTMAGKVTKQPQEVAIY